MRRYIQSVSWTGYRHSLTESLLENERLEIRYIALKKDTECEICLCRISAVASCLGYIYLTQAILRKASLVST